MAAIDFYNLTTQQKLEVFTATAQRTALPIYAVEKDWWVTQTLDILFSMPDMQEYLIFKGGTSLSKAWQLITRFSEDIDLSLNREYLGFETGFISKSQVKKLRKVSFKFVSTTFFEALKKAFKDRGYDDVTFDFENLGDGDQDPVSIIINYPAVVDYSPYILPRIKVELGSRSLKDPCTHRSITSLVTQQFPDRPFSDQEISIPCVNPERTYLEKLFLLHEEFKKPEENIRVDRLSRHLYDIYQIYNSEYKTLAYDPELITTVIEHRRVFNAMRGIDYDALYAPYLQSLPPAVVLKRWKDDYREMQTSMIQGDSPDFDSLIATVAQAVKEYNDLK